MPQHTPRKPKKVDLMQAIAAHLDAGTFYLALHADERRNERNITQMEVEHVLRHGRWEKKKDAYNEQHQHPWSYAVRGDTIDKRQLRVAVGFEEEPTGELMLIITVIDLDSD